MAARFRIERLETSSTEGARLYLHGYDKGVPVSRRHLPTVRKEMKGK
ncbi:MAG: hypothetical protein ACPGYX_05910 [Oceanobacter sp.]